MAHEEFTLSQKIEAVNALIDAFEFSLEWDSPGCVWLHPNADGVRSQFSVYAGSRDEVVKLYAEVYL